jgi:serine/threonine protein kinase
LNIVVSESREIRIIDFGVSHCVGSNSASPLGWTHEYAPLEYLLGSSAFSHAFDVWRDGCLLTEMLLRRVLFQGEPQLDVTLTILQTMGTPTEETWVENQQLEYCRNNVMPEHDPTYSASFAVFDPVAADLLLMMLCISQGARTSAHGAL